MVRSERCRVRANNKGQKKYEAHALLRPDRVLAGFSGDAPRVGRGVRSEADLAEEQTAAQQRLSADQSQGEGAGAGRGRRAADRKRRDPHLARERLSHREAAGRLEERINVGLTPLKSGA